MKPLQSGVFSYLQLFSSRILWETKQFNFSLVNFSLFLDNKYNEHSFFRSVPGILLSVSENMALVESTWYSLY